MMDLNKPIHVDNDIPVPATTNAGIYHVFLSQLMRMKIGDSFFREGESSTDVQGLIRYAKRNSIHLKAYDVEEDEVNLTAGCRIYRVTQDSLPGRKPAVSDGNKTYWILKPADTTTAYPRVQELPPGETPSDPGWTQIAPAQYYKDIRFCPDHVDYWAFDESGVCWTEWKNSPYAEWHFNNQCEMISAEGFITRVAQGNLIEDSHAHDGAASVSHWRSESGLIVSEYLPGRRPPAEENWTQITRDEYAATIAKQNTQTKKTSSSKNTGYWRQMNGVCVKADKSPQRKAVQISESEYNDWLNDEDI